MKKSLSEYITLIEGYLAGRIMFEQLENDFHSLFEKEDDKDRRVFDILDGVFGSLRSYWPDLPPEEETSTLTRQ